MYIVIVTFLFFLEPSMTHISQFIHDVRGLHIDQESHPNCRPGEHSKVEALRVRIVTETTEINIDLFSDRVIVPILGNGD